MRESIARWWILAVCGWGVAHAQALTLDRVISRENPGLNCASAELVVGRDGRAYLTSGGYNGYILRISRDGKTRDGAASGPALALATANADGLVAAARSHFTHAVTIHDRAFTQLASNNDFLNNDAVGWDAPTWVEPGAGGDFYAVDPHRSRIVRLAADGRIVTVYPGGGPDLRVLEGRQAFYWRGRGELVCAGFSGATNWTLRTAAPYDVADDGTLYTLDPGRVALVRYSPAGQPAGEVALQLGAGETLANAQALRVSGSDVVVKRSSPTELFRVFDLQSGARKATVSIDYERLQADLGTNVWTAGADTPFAVRYEAAGRPAVTDWRVEAAPLGDDRWVHLARTATVVVVPADFAGLYQVRVSGPAPEYTLRTVVEVRRAGATNGTVSAWTPGNRAFFGRGEPVPATVVWRSADTNATLAATLALRSEGGVWWSTSAVLRAGVAVTAEVPAEITAALAPGRYALAPEARGVTCVPQPVELGPGGAAAPPFRVMQYGDYGSTVSDASVWDCADAARDQLRRAQALGINQFVNRIFATQYPLDFANRDDGRPLLREVQQRLAADPGGTAPEKAELLFPHYHALGAYGAHGIGEWLLLVSMDGGLPIGTGFDTRKPVQFAADIARYSRALRSLPAFQGWDWVANWWLSFIPFENDAEKAAYEAALKRAQESGAWDPLLDTVGDRKIGLATNAQAQFNRTLQEVAPGRRTASSGPYRRPEVYPPVNFSNVDEVDLHYQCEQISTPNWVPHAVDYMQRPGKASWMHPELWNDSGTGEQILPQTWLAVMRGATGAGVSGNIPNWGRLPDDARSGYAGIPSVFRAAHGVLREYGPWLATLENRDRVAIVVSPRLVKIDSWAGLGGTYFSRLFEAYQTCLYARHPARYVFPEDLESAPLTGFRAVLVVGQTVELEPALASALAAARGRGVAVFADGTCRTNLVADLRPLGFAFDWVEKSHPMNNDYAFWEFPERFVSNAAAVGPVLDRAVPPVARVDSPEVLVSERGSGRGRFVWVVNNTHMPLSPGELWRAGVGIASQLPVQARVGLELKGETVYDVWARREVKPEAGALTADLRYTAARLYAVLPQPLQSLEVTAPRSATPGERVECNVTIRAKGGSLGVDLPLRIRVRTTEGAVLEERCVAAEDGRYRLEFVAPRNAGSAALVVEAMDLIAGLTGQATIRLGAAGRATPVPAPAVPPPPAERFGPHIRDLAVSEDGVTALANTFNWDSNVQLVNLRNGALQRSLRLGQQFAYAPVARPGGFAVQALDLRSAEGYQLYWLDGAGAPQRRFALPGMGKRQGFWFVPAMLQDHVNNFAVAPDGVWLAACGNLGLVVWRSNGDRLWQRDWSATDRHTLALAALGPQTLVTAAGMALEAVDAQTGQRRWELTLATTGEIRELLPAGDGRTLVVRATTEGGRVFVVREGRVLATLPVAADAVAAAADGSRVLVAQGRELRSYSAAEGAQWTFRAGDNLGRPELAADGAVAVGDELGTLYVLEADGRLRWSRDLGARPVAAWLPDGDLVAGTWQGTMVRFSPGGAERWRTRLEPESGDLRGALLAESSVPLVRSGAWLQPPVTGRPDLSGNLLRYGEVIVKPMAGDQALELQNPLDRLLDASPEPPAQPWLKWYDVGMIDSGWRGSFSLVLDTFRTQLRVEELVFAEDPQHPESWLRDARLEYWDPRTEQWVLAQYLVSDAAVHTHRLEKPVEAARFRLVRADGYGWPQGNLRLAELVLRGKVLGASHPDVLARKPVAVLFDEESDDFRRAMVHGHNPGLKIAAVGGAAFSGGHVVQLGSENGGKAGAAYTPPFGHAIPNWDFEIVENPQPGQYRWLEFAWRATSPETRGVSLHLGGSQAGGVVVHAGEALKIDASAPHKVADTPPREWTVVRVDLWPLLKQPQRIRSLSLGVAGGTAEFDRIRLARTEADLSPRFP